MAARPYYWRDQSVAEARPVVVVASSRRGRLAYAQPNL